MPTQRLPRLPSTNSPAASQSHSSRMPGLRARAFALQSFAGHRDVVTALAFRDGSHQLFSASFDRTVKMWSLDDRAYMDTLFGHQAEVLCLDALRAERALTGGSDRTVRLWKVPEESQLVFRCEGRGGRQARVRGAGGGDLQGWRRGFVRWRGFVVLVERICGVSGGSLCGRERGFGGPVEGI
uniref:Uncharacterized protein n=1 Tax=Chlamydomonas euryale TaxID=1486919 RepID=A0A6U2FL69_9CHLO|mmetsp:Transcript_29273/g.86583  ORF Transcript_29273/g.86583 Transcript_29273/m.86583 type:complete len:183 (+) Transcript_29273:1573-2121(+)